jgi:hypothetical protein
MSKDDMEKDTRTEEVESDEKLLVKMRQILSGSVDWWKECTDAKKGKGLGAAKDSALTALQMVEKLETRMTGKSKTVGEWRVVFSQLPEEYQYEDDTKGDA